MRNFRPWFPYLLALPVLSDANKNNNDLTPPPGFEAKSILQRHVASACMVEEPLLIRSSSAFRQVHHYIVSGYFYSCSCCSSGQQDQPDWRFPGRVPPLPALQLATPLRKCYPQVAQHTWRNGRRKTSAHFAPSYWQPG
jgi:hypothetical protein